MKENAFYPMILKGKARKALVVGGGNVAERKIRRLLSQGVFVMVLSPVFDAEEAISGDFPGKVTWAAGRFPGDCPDLAEFDLVIAATNDRSANEGLAAGCREAGVWVNVVDNPELSDFVNPSVIDRREDGFLLAVSTFGEDPARTKRIREKLEELLEEVDWSKV